MPSADLVAPCAAAVFPLKAKWLLAWKAIKKAASIQHDNADVHFGRMRWLEGVQKQQQQQQQQHALVRELLEEEWAEAGYSGRIAEADVRLLNDRHLDAHLHSLEHRLAGQRAALSTHGRPPPALCTVLRGSPACAVVARTALMRSARRRAEASLLAPH